MVGNWKRAKFCSFHQFDLSIRNFEGQYLGFRLGRGRERSKWAIVRGGGELNKIFLQIEFRFRNGLGLTLALQSFRITHLINAEILAKICMTRNKNKVEKKSILMSFSTYYKIHYNGFQINFNAFCFCEKMY